MGECGSHLLSTLGARIDYIDSIKGVTPTGMESQGVQSDGVATSSMGDVSLILLEYIAAPYVHRATESKFLECASSCFPS
jgi:hypothetical protein